MEVWSRNHFYSIITLSTFYYGTLVKKSFLFNLHTQHILLWKLVQEIISIQSSLSAHFNKEVWSRNHFYLIFTLSTFYYESLVKNHFYSIFTPNTFYYESLVKNHFYSIFTPNTFYNEILVKNHFYSIFTPNTSYYESLVKNHFYSIFTPNTFYYESLVKKSFLFYLHNQHISIRNFGQGIISI